MYSHFGQLPDPPQ